MMQYIGAKFCQQKIEWFYTYRADKIICKASIYYNHRGVT